MKHVRNAPDLSEWGLDHHFDRVNDIVRTVMEETLASAMADPDTTISFPIEWAKPPNHSRPGTDGYGGDQVDDPLTIYLHVALCGSNPDSLPTYSMSLRAAIEDSIDACARDGSYSFGLGKLSESLRHLADQIDAAIAEGSRNKPLRDPPLP